MQERKYIDTLEVVYTALAGSSVVWVLTGSLSFAIRGMPFDVHDIDIQTDQSGSYEIERILHAYRHKKVTFVVGDEIRSHFGQLCINGVTVEIMGDIQKKRPDGSWEEAVDLERYRQYVKKNSMLVPVLSLEYEYHAYQLLGREHVAALLRQWMDEKGS
jgi:hypothetical protein